MPHHIGIPDHPSVVLLAVVLGLVTLTACGGEEEADPDPVALLGDSGCLTDAQQADAAEAVNAYTTTLQQALADLGYYEADVDGIYGPLTVEAVETLQGANGLPRTGTLDKATDEALRAELEAGQQAIAELDAAAAASPTPVAAGAESP